MNSLITPALQLGINKSRKFPVSMYITPDNLQNKLKNHFININQHLNTTKNQKPSWQKFRFHCLKYGK